MTKLSVNLNKVALLRNTRALGIPSVTRAAQIALAAGAHGITVHPRPDARHIRTQDVQDLAALLKDYPGIEFNIEGNPFENALDLVRTVRPHQFTLVPDDPAALTSDHGWNLERDGERLKPLIAEVKRLGVRVSLFMDAMPEAMRRAADVGADRVELYTEPYAQSHGTSDEDVMLARYIAAAHAAREHSLGINAGHDLNQKNLPRFVSEVPGVLEVSIGHALIADALEDGLASTVRAYLAAIRARA
ncbi:MAG: pyridoxine 5'-phosphate synthase [Pseudomonadota bacterium]